MPATAGRVRMPHNNRVSTSAALGTNTVWSKVIGHNPYAAGEGDDGDTSRRARQRAAAADPEARAQAEGIMELAKLNKVNAGQVKQRAVVKGIQGRPNRLSLAAAIAMGWQPDYKDEDEEASQDSESSDDDDDVLDAASGRGGDRGDDEAAGGAGRGEGRAAYAEEPGGHGVFDSRGKVSEGEHRARSGGARWSRGAERAGGREEAALIRRVRCKRGDAWLEVVAVSSARRMDPSDLMSGAEEVLGEAGPLHRVRWRRASHVEGHSDGGALRRWRLGEVQFEFRRDMRWALLHCEREYSVDGQPVRLRLERLQR